MNPVEFRRHLHAHPELSFREHGTAAFIEQQLTELGIEHRRIASTGVLARIEGRKTPAGDRRAVVLRADTDALPIAERNDCAWRSQNEGVMHACGHDMHAAVLFGVLKEFAAEPDFRGTLFGLFQPGEECNPGGASLVLAEKPFDGYDVRAVVGEHVEPQLEVGTLGFRAGKYMAASDELRFRIHGTGGHGAMRKQLKDPVAAGAELLTRLIALNGEECVLSIGRVEAGGATNIVPDEVYMEGTLRTFDERERGIIHRRIGIIAADNDETLVKKAVALARAEGLGVEMLPLRTTAEDFGFYCRQYPSLFYRLGVGAAAGRPHTATFSPDEGALDVGIGFMRRYLHRIAGKKLMKVFGGRLRFLGIGGAKLDGGAEKFLLEARFPYAIGYGLTETAPLLAGAAPSQVRLGSTGPAAPGVELRLENVNPETRQGEIVAKTPSAMIGYYKNPDATKEVFTEDGWFRTGDLGEFSADGWLYIKGRLKNMIVGPSGENIYPEDIESVLNSHVCVADSVVTEHEGRLVALVHFNTDALEAKFDGWKEDFENWKENLKKEVVDYVNSKVNRFSRISEVVEEKQEFVKTPTQKIRRFLYTKRNPHQKHEMSKR